MGPQEDAVLVEARNFVNPNPVLYCSYANTLTDPQLRNPSSDFRLSLACEAIGRCADAGAVLSDSEHQARGHDHPDRPNDSGAYDAGADEVILGKPIFSDRFGN